MDTRKASRLLFPALAAGAGVLLALLRRSAGVTDFSLPLLSGFGRWLRALSLQSAGGNGLAWGIVLVLALLPLALLFPLRRRGGWAWEDVLLPLLSVLLFALCYYLVNPSLLPAMTGKFFPMACAGTILSTGAAWIAFRLLRALAASPTQRLAAAVRPLLILWATLMSFGASFTQTATFLARRAEVISGNTAGGFGLTVFVLAVIAVLALLPDLLAALTLTWGAELASALGGPTFSAQTVELCRRTARSCRAVAIATMLIAVVTNLLQLLLLGLLRSSYYSVIIPVVPLALSVALYLLCRCLQRGQELQDDSDSII